ncbi:MAG TPA: hemerythrin domain-containing protein [Thermoplasmata archaeon]|nr:hemerythrin domain-containing protein [Thermoplasmata archaeon]
MNESGKSPSQLLSDDHRELDQEFEEFKSTPLSEIVQRRERFGRFSTELRHHIAVEERLLFPILEEGEPSRRALVDLMLDEHRRIEKTLQEISLRLEVSPEPTDDLEFELINVLWAHNAREEESVYPWFDTNLSRDQAKKVDQEFRTPRLGP